ncbi:peptide-methionine (S)-S-oxide reductase [Flavobacterium antarcticum]|uniref:peptide-methionine (S)-S-oxide reductase n=1 Tax=Flavobacterium antarcticum TaxID=271155 RepID=UPI0003B72257|nr:peptide-methionine (S)-S-oxide reductase [Flavobacterium antarcticum]
MTLKKIGFGGGCHWCTEAYFQALKGVEKVEQGWISATFPNDGFSEAVIIHYDSKIISVEVLTSIHLHTHASTKNHSFREKYRSAVYVFHNEIEAVQKIINEIQNDFEEAIITKPLLFKEFKLNSEDQQNYYRKNKEGAFCERYILPKLKKIESEYANYFKQI